MRQMDYLDQPARARNTDPDTSREAASSVTPDTISESQLSVYTKLKLMGPMSDEMLVTIIGPKFTTSRIRTARSELVTKGFVEMDGYGVTATGRKCRTWRAI